MKGELAELKIRWRDQNGPDHPVFAISTQPIPFRKVNAKWKIDGNELTGLKCGADLFRPGSFGCMLRDQIDIMNEISDCLEQGRIRTAKGFSALVEAKLAALEKKYEAQGGCKTEPVQESRCSLAAFSRLCQTLRTTTWLSRRQKTQLLMLFVHKGMSAQALTMFLGSPCSMDGYGPGYSKFFYDGLDLVVDLDDKDIVINVQDLGPRGWRTPF
jgi:hypothetical protein